VVGINDDCLLEIDFFKIVNLENDFNSVFGKMELENKANFKCRIEEISERNSFEKIPAILRKFFGNSSNLDETRKNIFANFFCEFEDVFSENIVAGNSMCCRTCYK